MCRQFLLEACGWKEWERADGSWREMWSQGKFCLLSFREGPTGHVGMLGNTSRRKRHERGAVGIGP